MYVSITTILSGIEMPICFLMFLKVLYVLVFLLTVIWWLWQDKDDPDRWAELKRQEADYEKRRTVMVQYYEAVRHAQQVSVDDIPLPLLSAMPTTDSTTAAAAAATMPGQIPLPADIPQVPPPPSILRKRSAYR